MSKLEDIATQLNLSPVLAVEQGLTLDDLYQIDTLHQEKNLLCASLINLDPKLSKQVLMDAGDKMTEIEFKLQEIWGFDKKIEYHSHWIHMPHCTCPRKAHNEAGYIPNGFGLLVLYSNTCSIHAHKINETTTQH